MFNTHENLTREGPLLRLPAMNTWPAMKIILSLTNVRAQLKTSQTTPAPSAHWDHRQTHKFLNLI